MKAIIKGIIYKVVIVFCALHMAGMRASADDRNPLWNVQNQFSKEGFGLKGPVYSVSTKRMTPIIELGQVVRTDVHKQDSLIFDENGKIAKKISFTNEEKVSTYAHFPDSVEYSVLGKYGNPVRNTIAYRYDSSNRIIEVKCYEDGKLMTRRVFEYKPTGFETKYYYGKKEITYVKKGTDFAEAGGPFAVTGKLDKEGRVISMSKSVPFVANTTTYYSYNQNGDLFREGNKAIIGNNVVGTLRSNETGYRYEYVYDEYGNWTEKRTYKDGELLQAYESREIIYKSPEEILAEKKAEAEKIRLFEEDLQRKGEEYATKFAEDRKHVFKEFLVYRANKFIRDCAPVAGFTVVDDNYSFEFSDGVKANNVSFEAIDNWTNYNGCDNLISADMHIVLIPEYTPQGPKWYVVRYGNIADFDFNPNYSTDWVKLYREKFHSRNNVSDNDIENLWKNELYKLWRKSECASFEKNRYYLSAECANELVNAYEKGFVSPSASNKSKERISLADYKKFKEDEKRKNLCTTAFGACVFNNKLKPEADKIKKFTCDGSSYYFKKKDNTEIANQRFDTVLSGLDEVVYLSSDMTVALVIKRTYADYYLFIVELDGDNVKSINYISPKDAIKFAYPTSIKHKYNTGFS